MEALISRVKVAVAILCATLLILACDVASLVSQTGLPIGQGQNESKAASTNAPQTPSAAGKSSSSAPAKDAQSRISDSLNRLIVIETKALDSYHVEASGSDPSWNSKTQKLETEAFTFKADVSGDSVHFIKVTKTDKETTTEGYIMGMSAKDGGKGYSVENGKLKEDLFMPLSWVMLPLDWGLPLIYASMGPTAKGEEAVDGRIADKFDVDIAKAPTGAAGALAGFGLNVYSSKGTAWVDKQSSALLKMNIDYERDVSDTSGGGKAAGRGSGHIELVVTQVGKVKVTLPDVSQAQNQSTTVPTKAASTSVPTKAGPTATATKAGPTATATRAGVKAPPSATPTPQGTAKVGQKVAMQGMAFTVTKVETVDKGASTGNTWVIVHLNVENTSTDDTSVSIDDFAFWDKTGEAYYDLVNGPSAPSTYASKVLDYEDLAPGDKITDVLILRQFKKTQIAGLKLTWDGEDDKQIVWNLGL